MDETREQRKARLAAIRAAARAKEEDETGGGEEQPSTKRVRVNDVTVADGGTGSSSVAAGAGGAEGAEGATSTAVAASAGSGEDVVDLALAPMAAVTETAATVLPDFTKQDLLALAPKSHVAQLEAPIKDKLELLERRTTRAIMDILKDKLAAQNGSTNASIVVPTAKPQ
ncbi:uncharacterized protein AMSG_06346 [Thecamonas trahens ATCC 50062]|uniref:Uncharacterized protein n=1 Tax=Thecamonas trahens ATCC 50062 TaxID=461836 RepID=A0A0L0DCY5_THETB|nr:hypothetical protein AMSG_06346 [Thecamonas trahens ATCC 50062]KNC50202.1 hypothetical protein AMSG_06346 [Thecamonas trahens ATCC 50062]|eukprot:XP_013757037.1 hypothetical protein AMSG_06346 [Thecamonas trahens ATCC 50062]